MAQKNAGPDAVAAIYRQGCRDTHNAYVTVTAAPEYDSESWRAGRTLRRAVLVTRTLAWPGMLLAELTWSLVSQLDRSARGRRRNGNERREGIGSQFS